MNYDLQSGERTYRDFEATGNGGQLLIVVPEVKLPVVITGGTYPQGWGWRLARRDRRDEILKVM